MQLHLTREDIEVLIASIISYELSKQNNTYFPLFFDLHQRGDLTKAPFSCDSLSLVLLATAVGDYFGVTQSGLEENFLRYRDFVSWVDIVADSLSYYSDGITFSTSGTTGEPQKVFHSMQNLQEEARYLATLLQGAKSISAFVRPHHIYGFLYTIALPKYMELQAKFYEPIPSDIFFKTPKDSLLISTPTLYDLIVKKEKSFNPNITAVSSTQPLKAATKEGLKEKGIEKVIEIYGSSQSLGVGYRWDNQEDFTLFDYLDQKSLCSLQDRLEWKNEREFTLCGRLDNGIKYRGYLMDLKEYEKEIKNLVGVKECNVVWSKGDIVAFITPNDKMTAMQSIAMHLKNKPDSIVWVNE